MADRVINIPYNSQLDNPPFSGVADAISKKNPNGSWPGSSQCFSTSAIMFLSTWIAEASTKEFEKKYLEDVISHGRIYYLDTHRELCKKRLDSAGISSQIIYSYNFSQGKGHDEFISAGLDVGSPVVISTFLTEGHIVCVIGESGDDWIVHDPFGKRATDSNKGYVSSNGASVRYNKKWLASLPGFINGVSATGKELAGMYAKVLDKSKFRYSANGSSSSSSSSNIGNTIVEIASKYVGVDATPYTHPNEQTWIFSWSKTGSNASELKNLMVQKSGYNGTGLFCDYFCRTIWVLAYEKAGRAELAAKVRDGFRFWDSNAPKPMTIAYVEEKFKKVLPDINFSDKPTVGAIMCFPGANPLNLAHNALVKSVSSDGKSFESINANDGNWLGKIQVASYTLDQVKGMKFIAPPPAGVGDFTDNNISVTSTQEQIVQFGPAFAKVYQRELFLNKTAFNGIKGAGSGIS